VTHLVRDEDKEGWKTSSSKFWYSKLY